MTRSWCISTKLLWSTLTIKLKRILIMVWENQNMQVFLKQSWFAGSSEAALYWSTYFACVREEVHDFQNVYQYLRKSLLHIHSFRDCMILLWRPCNALNKVSFTLIYFMNYLGIVKNETIEIMGGKRDRQIRLRVRVLVVWWMSWMLNKWDDTIHG